MNEVEFNNLAKEAGLGMTKEQYQKFEPAIFFGDAGNPSKVSERLVMFNPLHGVGCGEGKSFTAKPFPRVGDTLAIRHQVKRTSAGDVLGIQRADGRPTNAKITAVYLDGSVRCGHSEVWEVRPGTVGHWETINPDRVERS